MNAKMEPMNPETIAKVAVLEERSQRTERVLTDIVEKLDAIVKMGERQQSHSEAIDRAFKGIESIYDALQREREERVTAMDVEREARATLGAEVHKHVNRGIAVLAMLGVLWGPSLGLVAYVYNDRKRIDDTQTERIEKIERNMLLLKGAAK